MRAAPRAAPITTFLSVGEKRNARPVASTKMTTGSRGSTSAPFVTVDETAVADLNAFLWNAKNIVSRGGWRRVKRLTLVLGNEAADADSVACAVSLAYAFHTANDDDSRAYAPVVCVPREDFALRAETLWLLESIGVDVAALTFEHEIPFGMLSQLVFANAIRLVLVDHNAVEPSSAYGPFADAVDAVVDHHRDEKKVPATAAAVIVPTGSCATLVAEPLVDYPPKTAAEPADANPAEDVSRIFRETGAPPRLRAGDPRAALLLAAVLLDTQNLDASVTRVHDRDRTIVPRLASLAGCGDGVDRFHAELKRRRADQSALSPRDLLRRDYKQWRFVPRGGGNFRARAWDVGVASFGVPLGDMAGDARAIQAACAAFAKEKQVDALVLMCAFDDAETGSFRRQFATCFFDADAETKGAAPTRDDALLELKARLVAPGGEVHTALGGLEPVANPRARDAFGAFAFEQGDPACSRKKAQPALAAFFEGLKQPLRAPSSYW